MSHVTSHVTRHVTRHTSHVTRHTSRETFITCIMTFSFISKKRYILNTRSVMKRRINTARASSVSAEVIYDMPVLLPPRNDTSKAITWAC